MTRSATLLLLIALPVAAQTLRPCPDNGESSSTRSIRATSGTPVALTTVPKDLREGAVGRYLSFIFGNHPPADAENSIKPNAARKYQFGKKTFYTITVGNSQTIVSTACPSICTRDWWPADATILADLDRPPAAAPGDEFYAITKDTPTGRALLITSDITNDAYELSETCLVTLQNDEKRTDQDRDLQQQALLNMLGLAPSCSSDAFTLCLLDRFAITATRHDGAQLVAARVGARTTRAGTFALRVPDEWDVLVNATECQENKVRIRYVSMSRERYDVIVTDTTTGKTHFFTSPSEPRPPSAYDTTTFPCR